MKKGYILFPLLLICLLLSCKGSDDGIYSSSDIIGTWQLRAVLADPGDGSGEYEPVRSNKTIEFFEDGTFVTNVSFCDGSRESGEGFSGTYDPGTSKLVPDGCAYTGSMPTYSFEGNKLIIHLPCIEPCGEKYEKIS
ncbi:hypothetical protein PP178_05155 [Zeaxanthinibacter sp. PT1]|uniref:lipocalin family protein n=1 Tax=Zeaxanthinibacter TaxID=561554 RepID=UPI00234BC098|nr:lipocalin family protein [Zeaxanthinibacter sp. PT1]MDC6350930.1 hypothetical protein [Zeaxanthinibacter sp. PT1]